MDEAKFNLRVHCLQKGMEVCAGLKDHSLVLSAAKAFEKYLSDTDQVKEVAKLYTIEGSKK